VLLLLVRTVLWRLKPTSFKLTLKLWRLLVLDGVEEPAADG
jgi:hypothetical protein